MQAPLCLVVCFEWLLRKEFHRVYERQNYAPGERYTDEAPRQNQLDGVTHYRASLRRGRLFECRFDVVALVYRCDEHVAEESDHE